jgi:prophage tail gpP-like protein
MALEQVVVHGAGGDVSTFRKIEIGAGVKDAARTLSFTVADVLGAPQAPAAFPPGSPISATAGGDLLFTGYVDRLAPKFDDKDYSCAVSARSKGQDAVDSSVDHTKPDYVNSNVLAVAQDQDAFGIGFSADFSPDGFDRWRPNVGHTLWEALAALGEEEGATLAGQADGSIKITRAGETARAQASPLVEGAAALGGIWKGDGAFDVSAQHSIVNLHGQAYKGSGAQAIAIHAVANNSTVPRYRPLHLHHDRHTDRPRLLRRAKRRRDKEEGEGVRATAHVRGWRDAGGTLWTPGDTAYVVAPSLYLCQYMLIEHVVYTQGGAESEGTYCVMSLVDPRAHGGQGGGVNQSGAPWTFDDSAAQ